MNPASFYDCANAAPRSNPAGAMFPQSITICNHMDQNQFRSVDYIKRVIFPGGDILSGQVMIDLIARFTDMNSLKFEDIARHYARMPRLRRERFRGTAARVPQA
jgi:cyclopropane-fatty-acyl-phospholipid synthase